MPATVVNTDQRPDLNRSGASANHAVNAADVLLQTAVREAEKIRRAAQPNDGRAKIDRAVQQLQRIVQDEHQSTNRVVHERAQVGIIGALQDIADVAKALEGQRKNQHRVREFLPERNDPNGRLYSKGVSFTVPVSQDREARLEFHTSRGCPIGGISPLDGNYNRKDAPEYVATKSIVNGQAVHTIWFKKCMQGTVELHLAGETVPIALHQPPRTHEARNQPVPKLTVTAEQLINALQQEKKLTLPKIPSPPLEVPRGSPVPAPPMTPSLPPPKTKLETNPAPPSQGGLHQNSKIEDRKPSNLEGAQQHRTRSADATENSNPQRLHIPPAGTPSVKPPEPPPLVPPQNQPKIAPPVPLPTDPELKYSTEVLRKRSADLALFLSDDGLRRPGELLARDDLSRERNFAPNVRFNAKDGTAEPRFAGANEGTALRIVNMRAANSWKPSANWRHETICFDGDGGAQHLTPDQIKAKNLDHFQQLFGRDEPYLDAMAIRERFRTAPLLSLRTLLDAGTETANHADNGCYLRNPAHPDFTVFFRCDPRDPGRLQFSFETVKPVMGVSVQEKQWHSLSDWSSAKIPFKIDDSPSSMTLRDLQSSNQQLYNDLIQPYAALIQDLSQRQPPSQRWMISRYLESLWQPAGDR